MDFKYISIILILCYVVLNVVKKKFTLIEAFVILLPIKSISFEFGLSLYASQLPIFLYLIKKTFWDKQPIIYNKALLFFFIYVTISTIIVSTFFIEFTQNKYFTNYFRNEGRYISSIIKLLFFDFGIIFLIQNSIKKEDQIIKLIRLYLFSLIFLAILGIIQVVVSSLLSVDLFPNNIDNKGNIKLEFVEYIFNTLPFVRLTSLGGEPKNISTSLVIGLAILLFLQKSHHILKKNYVLVILLFIVAIFLTLSTSGILLLAILFLVYLGFHLWEKSSWRFKISYLYFTILSSLFIFFTWDIAEKIISKRIIERADQLTNEEVDAVIIKFLIENPKWAIFGSGLGNIHHLTNSYLRGDAFYVWYLKNNIYTSRYGYIKLISENGLIGFSIFIVTYLYLTVRLLRIKSSLSRPLFFILLTCLFFYFARANYAYSELLFFTGLVLGYFQIFSRSAVQITNN